MNEAEQERRVRNMRISSFELHNYKSFKDSPTIKLSSGFNVIVGQNNVGKSALLEALSLSFTSQPHKSLSSLPYPGVKIAERSWAAVTFSVTGEELRDLLWSRIRGFYFAQPSEESFKGDGVVRLLQTFFVKSEIDFSFNLTAHNTNPATFTASEFPSGKLYQVENPSTTSTHDFSIVEARENRFDFKFNQVVGADRGSDFGVPLAQVLRSMIYRFKAERLGLSQCPYGPGRILNPDAGNLPEVLMNLQSENPERYNRFNSYVRQVFPSIYEVRAVNPPPQGNLVEIVVWTEDPKTERSDLAIPLAQSGTGVGQVLALLYVVVTSDFPRVIIIDEPNSFLHPTAARTLIEILRKEFSKHQFIVTTHSPEIIRTANANTLALIKWEKPQSIIEQLNSTEVSEVQKCLAEVGAKLSDVFGADQVLWVEGETEEECFRLILDKLGDLPVLGRSIVAVRNTGDFESKRLPASLIWDIYNKLSKGNALLPQAIAFIFDREARTEEEIGDLKRRSDGRVTFIPRRMYESYLICPEALFAVMSDLATFQQNPIDTKQIVGWLINNGSNGKYIPGGYDLQDVTDSHWLTNVDAAKLLKDLFMALSDSKEEYRKTVHSVELTKWLLKNKPDALAEILKFLTAILEPRK